MSDPKSRELLDQFLAGKGEAAAAIFDRYVERLLALARTRIGATLRRRIDPEDVVQSAYRSFFLHAHDREYRLDRSGDLWRLLASTTINKLYGQIEKQTAAKRSIRREGAENVALAELADRGPTVVDIIAVAEKMTLIMNGLSADERFVLTSTLHGQSPGEIATTIGKSERTVRRLLAQAKDQFETQMLANGTQQEHRRAQSCRSSVGSLTPLRFADYLLEKLLGSGGMGKVYRATDKRSGKSVAIKSLHKSRQRDNRAVARFVQESQVLAMLRHPNIVGVQGLGQFPAGGYFIVMDLVDGADLQTRLKSGPFSVAEAVSICRDVASAVQHAHERGVIHCDLKPANVLIGTEGRVIVTDFGFACIRGDTSTAGSQAIGGTVGFLAPEMLRPDSRPEPAADIFALGAMLWTLVAGQVPLSLDTVQAKHHDTRPIEGICRRCLARKPADRFPTVTEMIDALEALQAR